MQTQFKKKRAKTTITKFSYSCEIIKYKNAYQASQEGEQKWSHFCEEDWGPFWCRPWN
jgi:hypothetical protein